LIGSMSREDERKSQVGTKIDDLLTDEERRKLLANLHRVLVWVGVKEPEECEIDPKALISEMEKFHQTEKDLPPEFHVEKGKIELHHLIWRLINEKEISEQEQQQIMELIDLLEKKERQEEDILREEKLTFGQAEQIFHETAGVIRALLDLKDLLKKAEHTDETRSLIQRKVGEAKRWNEFLDKVKKD